MTRIFKKSLAHLPVAYTYGGELTKNHHILSVKQTDKPKFEISQTFSYFL